jgi:hypothetical protein
MALQRSSPDGSQGNSSAFIPNLLSSTQIMQSAVQSHPNRPCSLFKTSAPHPLELKQPPPCEKSKKKRWKPVHVVDPPGSPLGMDQAELPQLESTMRGQAEDIECVPGRFSPPAPVPWRLRPSFMLGKSRSFAEVVHGRSSSSVELEVPDPSPWDDVPRSALAPCHPPFVSRRKTPLLCCWATRLPRGPSSPCPHCGPF